MKKILTTLIITSILLCKEGFSAKLIDSVVASVNGNPITLLDLRATLSIILEKDNWDELKRDEKNKILNEVIKRKLLLSEAEKIGITVEKREIEVSINDVLKSRSITKGKLEEELRKRGVTWSDYTDEISYQILKEKVLQRVIFPKIQDDNDALKNFYLTNRNRFKNKESVHLYHIMLPFNDWNREEVKKTAEEIYRNVNAGEKFETVAEKYTGKSLSDLDIGFVQKGDLLPEFDRAVFSTPVDKATKPIKSEKGYHIFYVKDRRESIVKSFEESLPEVRELYLRESADKLYDEWLTKIKEKYVIKIIDKDFE